MMRPAFGHFSTDKNAPSQCNPKPNTATVSPGFTLGVSHTAPNTVGNPHTKSDSIFLVVHLRYFG